MNKSWKVCYVIKDIKQINIETARLFHQLGVLRYNLKECRNVALCSY